MSPNGVRDIAFCKSRGVYASLNRPPLSQVTDSIVSDPYACSRELVTSQHLLADRVTEVVREDVRGLDAEIGQQRLVHVGVVTNGVLVGDGLVGEPHPDHVGRDHA